MPDMCASCRAAGTAPPISQQRLSPGRLETYEVNGMCCSLQSDAPLQQTSITSGVLTLTQARPAWHLSGCTVPATSCWSAPPRLPPPLAALTQRF